MSKRILFLTPNPDYPSHHGRWPYVLDGYREALAGLDVEIFDQPWSEAVDCDYDLITPLVAWGYHNAPEAFCAALQALEGRSMLNPADIVAWNVDKRYLKDLAEAGVRIIPTVFTDHLSADDIARAQADFGDALVLKPVFSAGAKNTIVWRAGEAFLPSATAGAIAPESELKIPPPLRERTGAERSESDRVRGLIPAAAPLTPTLSLKGEGDNGDESGAAMEGGVTDVEGRTTTAPTGPAMIQPFMPAIQSEGEWSLLYFGGQFSHAVLKTPKSGDFRSQPDYDAHLRVLAAPAEALALGDAALDFVGRDKVLYARADMVRHEDGGFCLMELELIEPDLYLSYDPEALMRFKDAVEAALGR